ncbi:hypothetical protein QYE76_001081 [Lolium multiflorum]|uniref:Uncharacterized protein n=1 Tax=Lolium multiflorum TaxID=4521 RepID=A0AAD8RIT7_LOLMU|nr:hypothetical protein QYE76_001081 [Lolium multiflorum]
MLSELVVVLKGDPLGIQRLPDKFAEFVAGNEPPVLHLREHDLKVGCVLTFSYLGEGDMSGKVFDDARCHGDNDEEDD